MSNVQSDRRSPVSPIDAVPFDPKALRAAFGSFATGVTVVTTYDKSGRAVGFTANSFTSVSLDPAILLVCLGKTSSNYETFTSADRFGVNILSSDQTDISTRFATRGLKDRFAGIDWQAAPDGAPLIEGCAARFDCSVHECIDAGDHVILMGRIERFDSHERHPLIFAEGRYLAPIDLDTPQVRGSVRLGAIITHDEEILLRSDGKGNWHLPLSGAKPGLRSARADLDGFFAAGGASVDWGFLFAIFDGDSDAVPGDADTLAFFHGALEAGEELPSQCRLFPMDELPMEDVPISAHRAMLRRYVDEHRQQRFGIYVDSPGPRGTVQPLALRPAPYARNIQDKEIVQ
nr:flavin reductase family protein [Heliomarina baculiformis]